MSTNITSESVYRVIREYPHIPTVAEIAASLHTDVTTVRAHLSALRAQGKVKPLQAAETESAA